MKLSFIAFCVIFLSRIAFAADMTVEMLNKLEKDNMVFSQKQLFDIEHRGIKQLIMTLHGVEQTAKYS